MHAPQPDTGEEARRERAAVGRGLVDITHVLACVDRSAVSESCIPHAIFLARVFGAKMTVLHVLEPPGGPWGMPAAEALGWEIARHEAQAYLDRLRGVAADAGVTATTLIAEGHPAASIVSAARDVGADVTVLGTHGEGGHVGWALGSTAWQVLASTSGSVLVARASPNPAATFAPRTILVPLDGSTRAECVLPQVVRIARAYGATVLLVHVVIEPVATAILPAGADLDHARAFARRLEAGAERYLDRVRARVARERVPVRAMVLRSADERQTLVEVSDREGADLIVVAAHGSTCNVARQLGTVSSYLVTHARPPLLVLQDLPQAAGAGERQAAEEQSAAPLRGTIHARQTGVP